MGKGFKERIAFEVLTILGMLTLLCLVTRLWPLLFLVIPGVLAAALRLLFLSVKRETEAPISVAQPEASRPCTEQDVVRIAFGILQRRVTEHVTSRRPSAGWVWDTPNARERFAAGLPLTVMLNRAGGFGKAAVRVQNLQFKDIVYETAEEENANEASPGTDAEGCESKTAPNADETVDYALVAFRWTEANLLALNNRCNDAVAEGRTTFLIPTDDLPHPDSWAALCRELTRNGFAEASVGTDGIGVALPNNSTERE
jgi:hypothetical protein